MSSPLVGRQVADVQGEPVGGGAAPGAVPGGAEPGLVAFPVRDHGQAGSEDRRVGFIVQPVQGQERSLSGGESVGHGGDLLSVAEDQPVRTLTGGNIVAEAVVFACVGGRDDQFAYVGAVQGAGLGGGAAPGEPGGRTVPTATRNAGELVSGSPRVPTAPDVPRREGQEPWGSPGRVRSRDT